MKYYLAIDLGATSGRHVIGYKKNDEIVLEEIHRFKTQMDHSPFGLVWDVPRIFNEIKIGIKKAFLKYPKIESLAIDSWGVDYVLMDGDKEIPPYYAYRNERNTQSVQKLHKILSFKELFERTGIQHLPFNTIYQLYDDSLKGRLTEATDYLMIPSYFSYKLTGVKTHEYTNESSTALLNPYKKEYDLDLIDKLSLPRKLFGSIDEPGKVIGTLKDDIKKEVGGNTKVILCASHDTASAFESVDTGSDSIIISSGTWSLLGIKSKSPIINEKSLSSNYTNEGGVGYIRFLKNIMGMYIPNRVKEELNLKINNLDDALDESDYEEVFDVNDSSLMSPINMRDAVLDLLKNNPPKDDKDLFKSIYKSLALSYKNAIEERESITERTYSNIYIIGGGAHRIKLNKLIGEYTNKKVVAIPIEATALGNIKVQMKGE